MARPWHILRDPDGVTLARALPPRFDVQAETVLPAADPLRLAQQIRQDMWRALQRVRGFSPVVRVEPDAQGQAVRVIAGGRIAGVVPPDAGARIAGVLAHPGHRARWVRFARLREGAL